MRTIAFTIALVALLQMQHGAMSHHHHEAATVTVNLEAPRASNNVVDPSATLKPDDFDAPRTPVNASANAHESYYTCPMHPEVHSATPGKCPICGMTLVKKDQ